MSRFWAGDDSGSSSAESDSGSESEQEKKVQTNRWAAVSDSDSSDEGERVVRSAKDKAWDGMKAVVSKISNARKINDWHEMQTQFDLLNKQVDKAKTHIQKEGLPRFYIRTLAELEDSLDVALKDKEAQKKMSKANGRALNRMKLQLRRHNKEFEAKITEYRANPDAEEESDGSFTLTRYFHSSTAATKYTEGKHNSFQVMKHKFNDLMDAQKNLPTVMERMQFPVGGRLHPESFDRIMKVAPVVLVSNKPVEDEKTMETLDKV